jgi:hypothetical protein
MPDWEKAGYPVESWRPTPVFEGVWRALRQWAIYWDLYECDQVVMSL